MNGVCKDCERRTVGCHSACEEYKAWKREHDERVQKISEGRAKDKKWAGAQWTQSRWKKVQRRG